MTVDSLHQPCDLFQTPLSRAPGRPSTDGTSHLHERTNYAHFSRHEPDSTPTIRCQTITFGERTSQVSR